MKKIKVYNTLGRKKETVNPENDRLIRIYSCGPTVYDYAHIGNLRKYLFDDLLKRTLLYFGFKVKHVMNITDVGHLTSDADEGEDKIQKKAKEEKKDAYEIAKFYEKAFLDDLKSLNILKPQIICRATEHIDNQIKLIEILEKKGYTYKTSEGIYFDTSKLKDYGKLSGQKAESLKAGIRIGFSKEKRNSTDFALWKFSPKGDEQKRQMEWNSPWGIGFPGWHIECSTMSTKYLGQPFEIHTGGVDLISVHHTNEIAQSEAAFDKPLAKYWLHSEFVLENRRKMAKSAGHFIRLKDLENKSFSPLDFRMLALSSHYRTKLDFTLDSLSAAREARKKLLEFSAKFSLKQSQEEEKFFNSKLSEFESALADDLDSPKALAIIFTAINQANRDQYFGLAALNFIAKIEKIFALGLGKEKVRVIDTKLGLKALGDIPKEILELVKKRQQLRNNKKFNEADKLRKRIGQKGFAVEDKDKFIIIRKS